VTVVLVVEDEPGLRRALELNLRARGYDVETAGGGEEALRVAGRRPPDLVVLDLGLPDLSGLDVIAGLRGWWSAPILVLSARSDASDKIDALDAGADDYLTKPFVMEELVARLRAALRRSGPADAPPRATLGSVTVDLALHRAWRGAEAGDDDIRLTPTEWRVLELLLRNAGRLVGRDQVVTAIWGPHAAGETPNLRMYMARLRAKLEADPSRPRYLLTEPGMGYRFRPDAA
jgi:two-component system KDP operon response regulator KdpE